MKVLSLFDGISCGMVALERAGIKVERYTAYEIDENAIKISSHNYPNIEHKGNVFDAVYEPGEYDLLIGGSPCTQWSITKRNRETTPDGIGGQLFMQYVRALKESGCKYFLYENNYSIHQNIKDFISEQLGVQPITIDSSLLSAQTRKRCYWTNIPGVIQPTDKHITVKDITEDGGYGIHGDKSQCMLSVYYKLVLWNSLERRQRTMVAVPFDPSNKSHIKKFVVKDGKITLESHTQNGDVRVNTYNIDVPDGEYFIRKFSPVEAERLQTLPDNYTLYGMNENNKVTRISDMQRYKTIGNGWTVDVIAHILKGLK